MFHEKWHIEIRRSDLVMPLSKSAGWLCVLIAGCNCIDNDPPPDPVTDSQTIYVADPPAGDGAVAINLTSGNDEVIACWVEPSGAADHRVRFSRFDTIRRRWQPATTVTEGPDVLVNSVEAPAVVRSANGSLLLTFLRSGSGREASSVHLASSLDGERWSTFGAIHDDGTDTEHAHVSLVPEADGARAVWLDGRAWVTSGPTSIRTALLRADGSRSDDAMLDEQVCDCCQTTAAQTPEGPIVVYRDRDEAERRDLSLVRREDGGWSAPAAIADDGWMIRGCPVNGPQVAAFGRRVVAAWYTEADASSRLRVAFSSDAGAHFEAPISLDAAHPLGRVDVEWMSDGSAVVAWLERQSDNQAHLQLRRVAADRRVGPPLELATLSTSAAFGAPRMARLGADLMVGWSEPGSPTHVRATVVAAETIGAIAGDPIGTVGPRAVEVVPVVPASISLRTLSGEIRTLGSFRGRPLLMSVFASWCAPCRDEIPVLAALAREYGDAVAVVGVSVDESSVDEVERFARDNGVVYPVLLDPGGVTLGGLLGAPPLPATFVFDEEGRIVLIHRGGDGLEAQVRGALGSSEDERAAHEQDHQH